MMMKVAPLELVIIVGGNPPTQRTRTMMKVAPLELIISVDRRFIVGVQIAHEGTRTMNRAATDNVTISGEQVHYQDNIAF